MVLRSLVDLGVPSGSVAPSVDLKGSLYPSWTLSSLGEMFYITRLVDPLPLLHVAIRVIPFMGQGRETSIAVSIVS